MKEVKLLLMYAGNSLFVICYFLLVRRLAFSVFCWFAVYRYDKIRNQKQGIPNKKPETKNPLKENKKPALLLNAGFDQKWFYPLI
ncbi:hypothetical protein [Leeuwenhoekiella sp. H156]|uniref:hypothetical protein n=1 Tax=Leeuwenhoekiella sp. H156 TaxID=3450128 RepID=UPI003FA4571B